MAPQRSTKKKLVGTVVKTTKKFVEETLKVSVEENGVVDSQIETQTQQESQPIQESNIVEIIVGDKEAQEQPKPVEPKEDPKKAKSKSSKAQEARKEPTEPKNDEKAKSKGKQAQQARGTAQNKSQKRKRKRNFARGEYTEVQGNYKRYVFKVLKQVHPELGMSLRAMTVIDAMMNDMFERIAEEAARLSKYTKRATLSSREVQAAVRLVLPGELGKHAVSEGTKAVSNYVAAGK